MTTVLSTEVKVGNIIKQDGYKFTVRSITNETYKNGTKSLLFGCSVLGSTVIDSWVSKKITSKVSVCTN